MLFHILSFYISGNQSTVTLEKQWQILSFERIVYSETLGSVFMTDSYLLVASVYLWMSRSWWVPRAKERTLYSSLCYLINSPEWAGAFKHYFSLVNLHGKEGTSARKSWEIKHMTTENVYVQIKAYLWIPNKVMNFFTEKCSQFWNWVKHLVKVWLTQSIFSKTEIRFYFLVTTHLHEITEPISYMPF